MPSSHNSTVPSPTVTLWQPMQLDAATPPVSEFTLPVFEIGRSATPSVHAFQVSNTVGVPDHLLASATAAARATGYAKGWSAGMAEARDTTEARIVREEAAAAAAAVERDTRHQQAFTAFFDAATDLEARATPAARDIEEQIVSAAWTIASALVGHTLADDAVRGPAALKRALGLAPTDEDVTVSVSLDDFAVLAAGDATPAGAAPVGAAPVGAAPVGAAPGDSETTASVQAGDTIRRQRGLRTVHIVADPAVKPGDAIASCGATTIDARLSAAMDRVKQVLAT